MHCYPWNLCNESTIDKSLSKQQQYCRPTSKYIIALHHKHAVDPLGLFNSQAFNDRFFAFCRLFSSPGGQLWQNKQSPALLQPLLLWKCAHGRQVPAK
mmetsp:Transcript_86695/g.172121  ORF Transcript_86695/g.172121 Transcript_86695/m.172121 type:complete len:98 (-) Transcript_86695:1226-1519(-)